MSSLSQTPEFYVGQIIIGKPDDEYVGVKGSKLLWRNKPLTVLKVGLGCDQSMLEVSNGEKKATWFEQRFTPYKPKDMKDYA